MKNLLFITLIIFGLFSCDLPDKKNGRSENIYLRQLVKTDEVTKEGTASYFLVMGSASYSEGVTTKIKLMGKVNGFYRLIQFDFIDARIKIDNTIEKPYLYITYRDYYDNLKATQLLGSDRYSVTSFVIVCPEKYLPEKLLPMNL